MFARKWPSPTAKGHAYRVEGVCGHCATSCSMARQARGGWRRQRAVKGASHPPGQLLTHRAVYCCNKATPEPQWPSMFNVISYTKSVADAPGQQVAFCRVTQGPRLLPCRGSAYPQGPGGICWELCIQLAAEEEAAGHSAGRAWQWSPSHTSVDRSTVTCSHCEEARRHRSPHAHE